MLVACSHVAMLHLRCMLAPPPSFRTPSLLPSPSLPPHSFLPPLQLLLYSPPSRFTLLPSSFIHSPPQPLHSLSSLPHPSFPPSFPPSQPFHSLLPTLYSLLPRTNSLWSGPLGCHLQLSLRQVASLMQPALPPCSLSLLLNANDITMTSS